MKPSAIVVGAGIVGLATTRALCEAGYQVTVFDRSSKAVGASVRNFGMVWPIGQPEGKLYDRALRAQQIWKQVLKEGDIWHHQAGSLHMAYHTDELEVMEQFVAESSPQRPLKILTPAETLAQSQAVNPQGLLGALYSADEMIVDPREAIASIPGYLTEKYGVQFHWDRAVTEIAHPHVSAGGERFSADVIYVCGGADFETLYPDLFREASITKCKLQMLRLESQPNDWKIGPSLCGGLSLIHYDGFKVAPGLTALKERYAEQYPEYLKWGIHVMASQNGLGEITVGDSHEYGLTFDPFDREFVNKMILDYLATFAQFKSPKIAQTWHGIYSKMKDGATEVVLHPEPGVTIVNGLGGAGMTLSFGLCEEVVQGKYTS
ncbi:FAD dependent oxidoreductase TIGR03364 [Dyadobacter jejuensis]|uniref:FAD dependent oxidoreductase TIGR03364 n=1 Tax=Dyadobacter jejuensis TaxID=1082580 RepID=A0A316AT84_9BACT|nr:TIGR03364 family FAD-dependent oxidoreductase [Dyadobacter jejuensis]PWJ60566.1 FAD dependent oxidoreductase TIGR03364 [Dyadobacter jejuensis]